MRTAKFPSLSEQTHCQRIEQSPIFHNDDVLLFSTVIVNMTHIEVAQNITHWPLFHNGVAASLAINRHACDMGDNWIRSQILKNNDITNEQAGFLYGLGLIGHFKNLPKSLIYSLLQKANELTMMASLLGICVSK